MTDVIDLAARRAARARPLDRVHAPAPVTQLPVPPRTGASPSVDHPLAASAPVSALLHLLAQLRLSPPRPGTANGESAGPPGQFSAYAHAVGVVLYPEDPAAAKEVKRRLLAAIKDDVTDPDALLKVALADPEPPPAA